MLGHVLGNCRLPNIDAELEQFTMDPWGAPKWIGQAHLPNEPADVQRDLRPATARSRSQAPIGPKAQAVPADHGVWRDNLQCRKRCRNPAETGKRTAGDPRC